MTEWRDMKDAPLDADNFLCMIEYDFGKEKLLLPFTCYFSCGRLRKVGNDEVVDKNLAKAWLPIPPFKKKHYCSTLVNQSGLSPILHHVIELICSESDDGELLLCIGADKRPFYVCHCPICGTQSPASKKESK